MADRLNSGIMCRRTYNTGEFMRGIIAVLVSVLSITIPLSAHGTTFSQDRPLSVSSSSQDAPAAHVRVYVFTEGAPADGAVPEDYQDRVDTVKGVLKAMARRQVLVAPTWTDADVVVKIVGREQTAGETDTREVFADVLFLGETVSVVGRVKGENWRATADDLVWRLSDLIISVDGLRHTWAEWQQGHP
jgi:hypothetical protein